MLTDVLSFEVDFNDLDRDGRLMASMRFASSVRIPDVGEPVWVADDEGNGCRGTVAAVEGLIIYVELDQLTWTSNIVLTNPFASAIAATGEDDEKAHTLNYGCELV
jgi:hypothetical protein